MAEFFPIETPYSSEEYKMMKNVVNKGIDSHLEAFTKSEFKKSPTDNSRFLWNIHTSELPLLYRRLEELFNETGDDDYYTFAEDVKSVASQPDESELDEEIDPYDPMDANQTIDGFPTTTSDLNNPQEAGVASPIPGPAQGPDREEFNQGIENYIDDDTIAQELVAEDSISEAELRELIRREIGSTMTSEGDNLSLANQNGANAKPANLGEVTDTERYEDIVFMQGEEANEAMDILQNDGPDACVEYLKQWHYPGESQGSNELKHGSSDKTYEKDGYIMSWNPYLPYIGLVYDTQHSLQEDSLATRHLAGQREKTAPLGQHGPHSQAALNEKKK